MKKSFGFGPRLWRRSSFWNGLTRIFSGIRSS
jgi:hypothetical protein